MSEEVLDSKMFKNVGIRANAERAKRAQLLVWIVMGLDVISLVSSLMQLNLLKDIRNGISFPEEVLRSNDLREGVIAILVLIATVVSAVTFIQWFRRAYYNLGKRANPLYKDGWAAGAWFVPIISLFRPYQIMKEMWDKTTQLINSKSENKVKDSTAILGVWWALWIISSIAGNFLARASFKAETLDQLISSTMGDVFLSIIGIPLAIVAVLVIRKYAAKEEELNQLEAGGNTI